MARKSKPDSAELATMLEGMLGEIAAGRLDAPRLDASPDRGRDRGLPPLRGEGTAAIAERLLALAGKAKSRSIACSCGITVAYLV